MYAFSGALDGLHSESGSSKTPGGTDKKRGGSVYDREKIFRGNKDADEGKKVSNEEAKKTIEKWFE